MSDLKLDSPMDPIPSITLEMAKNPEQEGLWLQERLQRFLDEQFIPEAVNAEIARRATQIFVRQRMEGENDLIDRKSTRLNSSHRNTSRMPSSA